MAQTAEERARMRKLYKKLLKRVPEPEDINFLNITAMMDMMTIILVFMLKNMAVSTSVTVSPELLLPNSTTQIEAHQEVPITVTANTILVEDKPVVTVKRGRVDASAKRDGENGYFITPLFEILEKHATRLKKIQELGGARFGGELSVTFDKRTPFRLVSEVLYTAGQAEFNRHRLLVLKKEGG
jgi:biopolymer transport protein ExbD